MLVRKRTWWSVVGNLPARSITIVLSLPDGKPMLGITVVQAPFAFRTSSDGGASEIDDCCESATLMLASVG